MVAFGMQLPIQSQSTIFVQPWEPAAGVAELVQVTQACEAAGFDYVAVCDHIAVPAAGSHGCTKIVLCDWIGSCMPKATTAPPLRRKLERVLAPVAD